MSLCIDEITAAFVAIYIIRYHVLYCSDIVTDSDACIGYIIKAKWMAQRNRKDDLMFAAAGSIVRNSGASGAVHFLKTVLDTVCSALPVVGCKKITVFVKHIEITVLPVVFPVCKIMPYRFSILRI